MGGLAGLSILLVEDEYLIALDAEQMLHELGVKQVEIISTFAGAQARAAEASVDLALLDVNINGQLSFPIAAVLQRRGIPVVFATGYSLHDRPLPGFEGGICVMKPYTTAGLQKALIAALAVPQKT